MNKFIASALIAAAGFAAAPSFAGQYLGGEVGYFAADAAPVSTLTRAAVQANAVQAVRNGTLASAGEGADLGYVAAVQSSDLSRAQVRTQTAAAVQAGLTIGGE